MTRVKRVLPVWLALLSGATAVQGQALDQTGAGGSARTAVLSDGTVTPAPPAAAAQQGSTPAPERYDPREFHLGPLMGRFQARLLADVRTVDQASPGTTRRAADIAGKRVGVEGQLGRDLSFEVSAELGAEHPLRNAYAHYRVARAVRVRAGRFKVPFGDDGMASASERAFVSRSRLGDTLSMGRDTGMMLEARGWGRRLEVTGGVFGRDGDRSTGSGEWAVRGGTTATLRAVVTPIVRAKGTRRDLQVGFSAAASPLAEGTSGLRVRTATGSNLVDTPYWVHGRRDRLGADIRLRAGRFTAAAEYARHRDERRGQSVAGTDLPALGSSGWYASGTWFVTGESRAGGRVPRRSLFAGGPGAVELALRVEGITLGASATGFAHPRAEAVPRTRARAVTGGVNWQLHECVRLQVNVVAERVRGATTSRWVGVPRAITTLARVQVSL